MHCVVCKQDGARPGTATMTLERGATTVVIKNVPAGVCDNCGEYYLFDEMTDRASAKAETAVAPGAEIKVLRLAA